MDNNKKLAKQLLNYSINIKQNEKLLIELFGEDGLPLLEEIKKQAESLNVKVLTNIINYENLKNFIIDSTEQEMINYANKDLERMKSVDAYIGISAKTKDNEFENVPLEKMELYNKKYMSPVHLQERCSKRWCICRYPNKLFAENLNMSIEDAKEFFYNVCNLDYRKMSNAMDELVNLINKTDKVKIIGEGTNLSFSIKGIKAEKYVGNFNLPDGEVATAPVKESVNGYITYNTETKYNGEVFNNIRFEFKDGKIIKATANNTEALNKILDTDEGARYIGEFAIGLNPYITKVMGDTLFDEKICGSFHFTPGDSLEESDNGNRSSIHWDIVNIQTPEYGGGEIWFDNVLIRKDGKFVHENLKKLNPENLK